MSASREKKIRFEERAEGKEKRQIRAKDTHKAAMRKKIITTAAVVVVVLLLVFMVVFNSTLFYTGVPAVRMGSQSFTAADFNYEYFTNYYQTYSQIYSTYGDYASILLDTSKPLSSQYYSETQTWEEYFEGNALTQLQQMAILNDKAAAEGWTLTADQAAEIENTIDQVKTDAVSQGYSDYKAYLRAMYGKGFTEQRLRDLLRESFNATYYSQELVERWKQAATDEEKLAKYQEHAAEYNLISYMYYYVDGSADDAEGIDADTAMAAAKNTADEIASTADELTFADAVRRLCPEDQASQYADDDACLTRNANPNNLSSSYQSWLTDSARQYGDTTVIPQSTGYDVVMFVGSNDNSYRTVNYRGIVIPVSTDDSGSVNDDTMAQAKATVDEILAAYEEDPTEENFGDLAYEYAGDSTRGLQENVTMGMLSNYELEQYLFDEASRTPGEIYSFYDKGNYYIVYFVGYGDQYNLFIGENLISSEQYTGMMEAAAADYPIKKLFAFRFTK